MGHESSDPPRSSVSMIVDAYERLGGRLLGRMRDMREDVDADLAELRSELASLRTAVEDVADRVQLRQMRGSIDDLRSDVAGLRRAVLEWPELERMGSDLSALRSAASDIQQSIGAVRAPELSRGEIRLALEEQVAPALDELRIGVHELQAGWSEDDATDAIQRLVAPVLEELRAGVTALADVAWRPADAGGAAVRDAVEHRMAPLLEELSIGLAEVQRSIANPPPQAVEGLAGLQTQMRELRSAVEKRPPLAELAPLVRELGELRSEMVSLRRRIALRASASGSALGPQELDAIAEVVTARLLQVIRPQ